LPFRAPLPDSDRLRKHFLTLMNVDIQGRPESVEDAIALFNISCCFSSKGGPHGWLAGQPRGAWRGSKRGGDRGADGELYFKLDANGNGKAAISVKAGYINPAMGS